MSASNLYDDSLRMLWASKLVYSFADLLKEGRSGNLDLGDSFPREIIEMYKNERLDVRDLENGHGLPFSTIMKIVQANEENLKKVVSDPQHVAEIIEKIQRRKGEDDISETIFLETFASIDSDTQCVYGVLKDIAKKRITIVFRGSTDPFSSRDWQTNFTFYMEGLRTPKLLVDKLEGSLKERVLVHRGFYRYIFNNSRADGDQRYDMILDDIKPFVEDGYKIYLTGHSLGAALSSLVAFKLAGSDKDWIPKPITCITYASPFVGSGGFRTAFIELEKMGLIRYLRVNTSGDVVPTLIPLSFGWRKRFLKHVGINLRLYHNSYLFSHPNTNGFGLVNAIRNSMIKPLWRLMTNHLLPQHEERMEKQKHLLQQKSLEDLYADKSIFG